MFAHCFVIGSKHSESISNIRVVQVVFPDHVKGNPLIFLFCSLVCHIVSTNY